MTSNPAIELIASCRYSLIFGSLDTYPVAIHFLMSSHPLTHRHPRGFAVYPAAPQLAVFARHSSS